MVAILNKRTALSGKDVAMSSAIIQYFKEHEVELYALSIGFNKGMYALLDHAYDENREGYYESARQWIAEHPAEANQLFIYGVQTDKRIQKSVGYYPLQSGNAGFTSVGPAIQQGFPCR